MKRKIHIIEQALRTRFRHLGIFLRQCYEPYTLMIFSHSGGRSRALRLPKYGIIGAVLSSIMVLVLVTAVSVEHGMYQVRRWQLQDKIDRMSVLRQAYQAEMDRLKVYVALPMLEQLHTLHRQVGLRYRSTAEPAFTGGVGGVDLSMQKLPSELKNYSQHSYPHPISLGKEYTLEVTRDINDFFRKRARFIQSVPTLLPIDKRYAAFHFHDKTLQFQAIPGSDVYASANGFILSIWREANGLYAIRLDHEFGYTSEYQGLLRLRHMHRGVRFKKGDVIGFSSDRVIYKVRLGIQPHHPKHLFIDL